MAQLNTQLRRQLHGGLLSPVWMLVVAALSSYGVCPSPARAQKLQPIFHRISVEQGLSSSTVNAFLQDRQGFMWIGTEDGLNRFDGHEFKTFKHNPTDSTSLSSNAIWSLCEDSTGSLWVGTFDGGLNRFDPKSERATRYLNYSFSGRTLKAKNYLKTLCTDRSGTVWIGTWDEGLFSLNPTTGELKQWLNDPQNPFSLSENAINWILEDRQHMLWIGTRTQGLCLYDKERNQFIRLQHDPNNPASLSSNEVKTIFEDREGSIWVGTANGLNHLIRGTGTFVRYFHDTKDRNTLSDNRAYAIGESVENGSALLWIGTLGGGVNVLNRRTGEFTRLRKNDLDKTSLSDDVVRSTFTVNNNVWIGTESGGISIVSTLKGSILHLKHDPTNSNSLGKGPVYAITQDRAGVIWIGTIGGGLTSYTRSTGLFERLRNVNHYIGNEISAVHEDSKGLLWIGSPANGLLSLDRKSQKFTRYSANPRSSTSISSNIIDDIYEDKTGTLWIATGGGGLNKFDYGTGHFVHYGKDSNNPKRLSHDRVTTIHEGRDGTLWIGTEGGGINAFDRISGECVQYSNDQKNLKSLSDNRVNAIFDDHEGSLWVATSNGLNKLDRRTGEFQRYAEKDGLPSEYISAILEDKHNALWLVTKKGISRFSPKQLVFTNFDSEERFLGDDFSDACFVNELGEFMVGSSRGVSIFHPDSVLPNLNVPKIVVTSFNEFGQNRPLGESFSTTGKIELEHTQNAFTFAFAALDFVNPAKNKFAYKLEGYDKDWIQSLNRRDASYTNLSPGSYTFKVKGANNDGLWNEAGISTPIVIHPPFWERWWFRGLVLLAVAGVIAMLNSYRVSKLLEVERMRVRIASDLHDDVGSSLSAISLLTDMVSRKLPVDSPERKHLASATIATRNTADSLRDIVWLINPEHEKLDNMVLRMKDAASKLLLNIEHTFHTDENGLSNILDMEFRRNVILIYKEILNNATKHSQATRVDIYVDNSNNTFRLRIQDNGKGFDEATIQRGNGLNNLRFRAEKIRGTIDIKSAPGKGTTTELVAKIP